ncbi:MAG: histidine phosphatase family protein [Saprospiraceae bacterium]|nr:histidine phosphatase family protein [Saprospiraceae bacterium]
MDKLLYILRHGETDYNLSGIVQGRSINSHLNETGNSQALSFFNEYKHITFDRLWASTQVRTYQTIAAFEREDLSVVRDERIDEICWGEHEGKCGEPELMEKYHRIIRSWSNGIYSDKPEGGESAWDLGVRIQSFLDHVQAENFTTALIATHGRTLRAMMCLIGSQPLSSMEMIGHQNTCLYIVGWNRRGWKILSENNCDHLQPKILI